jgi:hypothetical protein
LGIFAFLRIPDLDRYEIAYDDDDDDDDLNVLRLMPWNYHVGKLMILFSFVFLSLLSLRILKA